MDMKDRLTGVLACVDPDVEASHGLIAPKDNRRQCRLAHKHSLLANILWTC